MLCFISLAGLQKAETWQSLRACLQERQRLQQAREAQAQADEPSSQFKV